MERIKKLKYLSWHRGTRENDLILGRFADAHLVSLLPSELDLYEQLLQCSDVDLFDWIIGRGNPDVALQPVIQKIQQFYT